MTTAIDDPEEGKSEFERVKLLLEEGIRGRLGEEANFRLVRAIDWMGECPSPNAIAVAKNQTIHQTDEPKVCMSCQQIFIPGKLIDQHLGAEVLDQWANFISGAYHKRTLMPPQCPVPEAETEPNAGS